MFKYFSKQKKYIGIILSIIIFVIGVFVVKQILSVQAEGGYSITQDDKAKIQRDWQRLRDIQVIAQFLEDYKNKFGYYPKLESGTYIAGMSSSKWPSWQETLGVALGKSLPVDPLNVFGAKQCASCPEDNPQCDGTCFNLKNKTYSVPDDSFIYLYRATINPLTKEVGGGYKLYAHFEYAQPENWKSNCYNYETEFECKKHFLCQWNGVCEPRPFEITPEPICFCEENFNCMCPTTAFNVEYKHSEAEFFGCLASQCLNPERQKCSDKDTCCLNEDSCVNWENKNYVCQESNWTLACGNGKINLNCGEVCDTKIQVANGTCHYDCSGIYCNPGYGNCDQNASNGCEINLNTDKNHCKYCEKACHSNEFCQNGECKGCGSNNSDNGCSPNFSYDCDFDPPTCSSLYGTRGYQWGNTFGNATGDCWSGKCCGDDSGEFPKTRICNSGACVSNPGDRACCSSTAYCAYNGCQSTGTIIDVDGDGDKEYCSNGKWYACQCSVKNDCCDGCHIIKDDFEPCGNGVCEYCYNGECKKVSSSYNSDMDPNDQCGTSGCLTGYCQNNTGICDYYTSGQHNCLLGYFCDSYGQCKGCGNNGNGCPGNPYNNDCDFNEDSCRYSNNYGWGCTYGNVDSACWYNMCCGDDSGEFYKTRVCDSSPYGSACSSDSTDRACCSSPTYCAHNGCQPTGKVDDVDGDGDKEFCSGGKWYACQCSVENDCCDGCRFRSDTTLCRPAAGDCDQEEYCSGSSASCPTDVFKPKFTKCNIGNTTGYFCDSYGQCRGCGDNKNGCSGDPYNNDCDFNKDSCQSSNYGWGYTYGNVDSACWYNMCCGDDSGEYYKTRTCNSGACSSDSTDRACCSSPTYCAHNGCQPTNTVVDVDDDGDKEYCRGGVWFACQCSEESACCDGCRFKSEGTICGYSSWNGCNGQCQKKRDVYKCSGTSSSCPTGPTNDKGDDVANVAANKVCSGGSEVDAPCRPAAGACDKEEYCSGSSASCPADAFKQKGDSCGVCKICDGLGPGSSSCNNANNCTVCGDGSGSRVCYQGSCIPKSELPLGNCPSGWNTCGGIATCGPKLGDDCCCKKCYPGSDCIERPTVCVSE
ncbi:MAG: Disintegrin [Parcubacteria group bacterium ADurb.Bin159]|nr:MAG: Disintegrin [Parcubacteria group bacterium ADurb.Bin159]